MKFINRKISIIIFVIFSMLTCVSCTGEASDMNEIEVKYRFSDGTAKFNVYYDDDYFLTDGGEFQQSLATCSFGLALSSVGYYPAKNDYRMQYKNALDFMQAAGFDDIYYNENYTLPTSYDSLSMIIGNKKIMTDEGETTLLSVTVKSGGYRLEWQNNLDMGDADNNPYHHHKGFYYSSLREYEFIKEYIESRNISGKVKIWMAGYSRGAAITNMTAGLIDQNIVKNGSGFEGIDLGFKDVYAYCFEAPQGVYYEKGYTGLDDPRNEAYGNIFSMLDESDPVTLVVMSQLGFSTYGNRLYYPNNLNDSDYLAAAARMYKYYSSALPKYDSENYYANQFEITGYTPAGMMESKIINPNVGIFMRGFMADVIKNVPLTREVYMEQYEASFSALTTFFYTGEMKTRHLLDLAPFLSYITDENNSRLLVEDIIHDTDAFVSDFSDFVSCFVKQNGTDMSTELLDHLRIVLEFVTKGTSTNKSYLLTMISMNNTLKVMFNAHNPVSSFVWNISMDPNYTGTKIVSSMNNGLFRRVTVQNAISMTVTDESGKTVAQINGQDPVDTGSGLTYGTQNDGSYVVYLPMDRNYSYKLQTGDTVSVTTEIYDPDTCTYELIETSQEPVSVVPGK